MFNLPKNKLMSGRARIQFQVMMAKYQLNYLSLWKSATCKNITTDKLIPPP